MKQLKTGAIMYETKVLKIVNITQQRMVISKIWETNKVSPVIVSCCCWRNFPACGSWKRKPIRVQGLSLSWESREIKLARIFNTESLQRGTCIEREKPRESFRGFIWSIQLRTDQLMHMKKILKIRDRIQWKVHETSKLQEILTVPNRVESSMKHHLVY